MIIEFGLFRLSVKIHLQSESLLYIRAIIQSFLITN